jgi:hypothetical protein
MKQDATPQFYSALCNQIRTCRKYWPLSELIHSSIETTDGQSTLRLEQANTVLHTSSPECNFSAVFECAGPMNICPITMYVMICPSPGDVFCSEFSKTRNVCQRPNHAVYNMPFIQ